MSYKRAADPYAQWRRRATKALKESIQHWRDVVGGNAEDIGPSHCACCREFYNNNCVECPVSARAHDTFCRGTPYTSCEDAFEDDRYMDCAPMLDYLIETLAMVRTRQLGPHGEIEQVERVEHGKGVPMVACRYDDGVALYEFGTDHKEFPHDWWMLLKPKEWRQWFGRRLPPKGGELKLWLVLKER